MVRSADPSRRRSRRGLRRRSRPRRRNGWNASLPWPSKGGASTARRRLTRALLRKLAAGELRLDDDLREALANLINEPQYAYAIDAETRELHDERLRIGAAELLREHENPANSADFDSVCRDEQECAGVTKPLQMGEFAKDEGSGQGDDMAAETDELLTRKEAARALGVSVWTVDRLRREGKLVAKYVKGPNGHLIGPRFDRAAVLALVTLGGAMATFCWGLNGLGLVSCQWAHTLGMSPHDDWLSLNTTLLQLFGVG